MLLCAVFPVSLFCPELDLAAPVGFGAAPPETAGAAVHDRLWLYVSSYSKLAAIVSDKS